MRKTLEEELVELLRTNPRFKYALKRAAEGRSPRSEMAQCCGIYYKKFNALLQLYADQKERAYERKIGIG